VTTGPRSALLALACAGALVACQSNGAVGRPVAVQTYVVQTSTQAVAAPAPDPSTLFVHRCGTLLCLGDSTFPLYGASVLTAGDHPTEVLSMARQARLNTVRVVSFLHEEASPSRGPYDEERWVRVDRAIALAGRLGLRVELDLTTYRNLLIRNHINAYRADWGPFVRFVATRRNTVSGRTYRDDPTIAMVAFAAEVEPPGSASVLPVRYTTADLTGFFQRTLHQWRLLDRNHVLTTGGFLHLDSDTGIDWRAIFSLPDVDVPSVHLYSAPDQTITLPAVAAFSKQLGKPFLIEEFGYERGDGDPARAQGFQGQYVDSQRYGAAGAQFWNLGPQVASPTYDVNPQTPLTWTVVRANRPASVPYALVLRTTLLVARLKAAGE
jgi:hypothetical protein